VAYNDHTLVTKACCNQGCGARTQIAGSRSSSRHVKFFWLQLQLQNYLVHWKLRTIVLFVQLYCCTKLVAVAKWYILCVVGYMQNSLRNLTYTQTKIIKYTYGNPCSPRNKLTRLPQKPRLWNRNPILGSGYI